MGDPVRRGGIRVLIVDDSAVVRQVLTTILSQERGLEVASAPNPIIAFTKMEKERPDVILLDIEMPQMDGLTFLQKVMAANPLPVVICSGHAGRDSVNAIRALELGAVEIINKPMLGVQEFLYESALLITDTVKAASQAKLRTRKNPPLQAEPRLTADAVLPAPAKNLKLAPTDRIVALGASTGGTEALCFVLAAMPSDAPGIVLVQHMPEGFTKAFADRVNGQCEIEVQEASSGDEVLRGRALIAPGNKHMIVHRREGRYFVDTVSGPLVSRHRPSVDVLFRSVTKSAGANAVGVLMTGMGDDGAAGLLEMKQAGARTAAQDQASCVVYGMPKEAMDIGAAEDEVPLRSIPSWILKASRRS